MFMTLSPAYRVSRHILFTTKCHNLHMSAWRLTQKKTHYEILDIARDATPEQIRAAYVKKSKELHPDLNPNQPFTHENFIRMTEAYNTLIKESSRQEYDFTLRAFLERKKMHRSAYSGHTTANTSTKPGTGFDQPDADEQVFWDETIWSMRDKSKDKEFKNKPYYGVRGVKRQPNSYILAGILVWIFGGILFHVFFISKSVDYARNIFDEKDMKFHNQYMERRAKAKLHGNELQMQLLKDQYISENSKP